jgi:ketosteroid isomerase-like protein
MKRMFVCLLLVSPAFASAQGAPASGGHAKDEQAIARLHDEWMKAFDAGDAQTLARIESEDFMVAGEFGERQRQEHLDNVRRRPPSSKSDAETTRRIDNRKFRFYGDTALITQTDHYTPPGGGPSEFESTEVWVRSGDSWKVAHLHFTRLAKTP